jgi:hypothetical protein
MSRVFINALGFLLFIGCLMALIYLAGGIIEHARGIIQ